MANKQAFHLAIIFQALGDMTRLRLLNLMQDHEVCVCYLVHILKQGQPKISRHLAYLRRANIVEARRDGKWIYYRIRVPTDPGAAQVLRATLSWIKEERQMRADLARLSQTAFSPRKLTVLDASS